MSTDQLRSWMTQYKQNDSWWIAFSSGTHPEPVSLARVEQTLAQYPHETISVLQVDQATAGSTEWVTLTSPAQPAAPDRQPGNEQDQPPEGKQRSRAFQPRAEPDGIDRVFYGINLLVLAIAVAAALVLSYNMASWHGIIAAGIIQPVGQFILLWHRLRNIGWSPLISLAAIIPGIGVILGPLALAPPPRFAETRKLDGAAIVLFCLVALLFITPVVIYFIQPDWFVNPYEGRLD